MERRFINLAAFGCVVLAAAASARAATFVYNLNQTPGVYPYSPGRPFTSGGPSAIPGDTESASGNTLTLVNPATSGGRGFYYYINGAPLASLTSASDYEIRMRATPTTNYAGSGDANAPILTALVADNTRMVQLGMAYDLPNSPIPATPSTGYHFYFATSGGAVIGTKYVQLTATDPDGFFNIRLKKLGTTVSLYVDDDVTPRLTLPYTSFSTAAFKELSWGQTSGSSTGTALVNAVNYGVNEAAPIVPEPATAALSLAALGAGAMSYRRRR